jgi:hypothetical protein
MSTDSQPMPSTQTGSDQAAQPAQPAPLPPDAVLVHVGMHKTGTTAMQSVLASLRDELGREGVVYPGEREAHHPEARALTRGSTGWQVSPVPPPDPAVWSDFAAEVRQTPSRVVISSEFFAIASEAQIRRLMQDIGPQRVHVLIGVRNLGPVAVSSWQQALKQGRVSTLDKWLKTNFKRSGLTEQTPGFWTKFDPAAAIARWSSVVGPDRVTVVVLPDGDRSLLPTTFERLLGLPEGRLAGQSVPRSNRGLTAVEAEVVRRVNGRLRGKLEWSEYNSVLRNGAIRRMVEVRSPEPDEARPELPAWVLDQVAEEGRRVADQISAAGVQVVGDLAELSATPPSPAGPAKPAPDLTMVPIDAVVEALVGAVAGSTHDSWTLVEDRPTEHARISETSTGRLFAVGAKRLGTKARRLLRRS